MGVLPNQTVKMSQYEKLHPCFPTVGAGIFPRLSTCHNMSQHVTTFDKSDSWSTRKRRQRGSSASNLHLSNLLKETRALIEMSPSKWQKALSIVMKKRCAASSDSVCLVSRNSTDMAAKKRRGSVSPVKKNTQLNKSKMQPAAPSFSCQFFRPPPSWPTFTKLRSNTAASVPQVTLLKRLERVVDYQSTSSAKHEPTCTPGQLQRPTLSTFTKLFQGQLHAENSKLSKPYHNMAQRSPIPAST